MISNSKESKNKQFLVYHNRLICLSIHFNFDQIFRDSCFECLDLVIYQLRTKFKPQVVICLKLQQILRTQKELINVSMLFQLFAN